MKAKRRIVKGIEHGFSGYTNHSCRCAICTEADRAHKRAFRARKYGHSPQCVMPRCERVQSQAYGRGLCYRHAQELAQVRKKDPAKAQRLVRKLAALQAQAKSRKKTARQSKAKRKRSVA